MSDDIIGHARICSKAVKLFDGGGLFLLINPNGSKYWRWKFRFAGKEKCISLGVYPLVSLEVARARRNDAQQLLRAGINPSEARRAAAEAIKAERALQVRRAAQARAEDNAKAKAADELRSLSISLLPDRTIQIRMGRSSLTLTDQGMRHLQYLLSRIPKRTSHSNVTN